MQDNGLGHGRMQIGVIYPNVCFMLWILECSTTWKLYAPIPPQSRNELR
jgi:hypothetical protein